MKREPWCYIVAAGSFYGMEDCPSDGDLILAVDGGYAHCLAMDLRPDLLVGDLDSLEKIPEGLALLRLPTEKDDTDTFAAVKYGLQQGYRNFHLYGCGGGRLDHSFGNLQILAFLAQRDARGIFYGQDERITAISHSSIRLTGAVGTLFSVFCFGHDMSVSIQGATYPLSQRRIQMEIPLGVSNSFAEPTVTIFAEDGCLLLVYPLKSVEVCYGEGGILDVARGHL